MGKLLAWKEDQKDNRTENIAQKTQYARQQKCKKILTQINKEAKLCSSSIVNMQ